MWSVERWEGEMVLSEAEKKAKEEGELEERYRAMRPVWDAARRKRLAEDRALGGHISNDGTMCGDGLYYHPGCTNPRKV
jgi:hypothetical protein